MYLAYYICTEHNLPRYMQHVHTCKEIFVVHNKFILKKNYFIAAPATVLLQIRGVSLWLDPLLHDWLSYEPKVEVKATMKPPEREFQSRLSPGLIQTAITSPRRGSQGQGLNYVNTYILSPIEARRIVKLYR